MRRHLAFEIHHGRAVGFSPPSGPFTTERQAATPNAAANTQPAAAVPTTQANRPNTTPAAAPTTARANASQDATNDKDKDKNENKNTPATIQAATTNVAAAPATTSAARAATTAASAVPTTPPAAPATTNASASASANANANANSVAAVNSHTSEARALTVTRTTKSSSLSSTSSSALPSDSAAADSGPGVGSIAGYAAAALAGVAVISIFAIWLIRRRRRRQDADMDAAPFNRQSWLRNSTMIDDAFTPATTNFPPPRRDPEMIDRSFNATPVTNYAGVHQYSQNDFGYAPQPSYQPGAVIFSPSSPHTSFGPGGSPATPLPFSPVYDPATPNPFEQHAGYTEVTRGGPSSPFNPYEQQQQFSDIQRQMTPSVPNGDLPAPAEDPPLSPRAPSPRVDAAPPVLPPIPANNADNADNADTFSRVPAYPELSPAPTSALGQVVEMRASTYMGQATPVQYGFVDGPQSPVAAAPSTPVVTTAPQPPPALQPAAARTLTRPETVYDTEDAYGGI